MAAARGDVSAGVAAAGLVTLELMAAGALETGSPWAPINAVAPVVLDAERAEERDWDPVATPVGLAVLAAGLTGWAALHHALYRSCRCSAGGARADWTAAAVSAAALAVFDYRVLPPARRPRLRLWLSTPAVAAKYAVFGAALALVKPPRFPR